MLQVGIAICQIKNRLFRHTLEIEAVHRAGAGVPVKAIINLCFGIRLERQIDLHGAEVCL